MTAEREVLEVAITGEGISPGSVPIKALADLLSATSAALEAASDELGIEVSLASLQEVRDGSAAYLIETPAAPLGSSPVQLVYDAARARGVGHSRPLKKALNRLHDVGAVGAGIRVAIHGSAEQPAILLAPTLEEVGESLEELDEVFGRVIAISLGRDGALVRLRLDGGTFTFRAENHIGAQAAQLWNQPVRARVTFARSSAGDDEPLALEEIVYALEGDFFRTVTDLRRDIAESGVIVDADEWLAAEGD